MHEKYADLFKKVYVLRMRTKIIFETLWPIDMDAFAHFSDDDSLLMRKLYAMPYFYDFFKEARHFCRIRNQSSEQFIFLFEAWLDSAKNRSFFGSQEVFLSLASAFLLALNVAPILLIISFPVALGILWGTIIIFVCTSLSAFFMSELYNEVREIPLRSKAADQIIQRLEQDPWPDSLRLDSSSDASSTSNRLENSLNSSETNQIVEQAKNEESKLNYPSFFNHPPSYDACIENRAPTPTPTQ